MNEFQRIAKYFKPLAAGFAGALELRDDAALLEAPPGQELAVTTDAMAEGTHFLPDDSPGSIARRLLRSNLSDLAAMGAQPLAYTLITALKPDTTEEWLASFASALKEDQQKYGCHLIGGDSLRASLPHFSITAFGLLPKGQALKRGVKRPHVAPAHYDIYVSGTIGDSTLGLALKLGKEFPELNDIDKAYLIGRHENPEPRIELAREIRGVALAAIDVSDGLVADIGHIAEVSQMQAIIEAPLVPLSPVAKKLLAHQPKLREQLLTGGEDYELVFIMDPREKGLFNIAQSKVNHPLTRVGRLQQGFAGEVQVMDENNRILPLKSKGWTHF